MSLQHIPLRDITIQDINALVENAVMEDRFIDYKSEHYGKDGDACRELCYDAIAFANALGGDIVCGVPEKIADGKNTGVPQAVVGLSNLAADEVIRTYYQVLNARIQPRLMGVEMIAVPGGAQGLVLIIRVPRSWAMPHLVRNNDSFKCYIRRGGSRGDPLDAYQLRDAFLQSATVRERMRAFRDERIEKIRSGQTPIELKNQAKIVVHVMSLAAMEGLQRVRWSRDALKPLQPPNLMDRGVMSMHHQRHERFNLDGYLTYDSLFSCYPDSQFWAQYSYVQIYSEGILEVVEAFGQDEQELPSRFGSRLAAYLRDLLLVVKGIDFALPAYVMVTLLGVQGRRLYVDGDPPVRTPPIIGRYETFDRPILTLPEVLVDDIADDMKPALRDALDALWQAGGYSAYFER